MKIDIDKLKAGDIQHWNQVAPSGATHIGGDEYSFRKVCFYKIGEDGFYYWYKNTDGSLSFDLGWNKGTGDPAHTPLIKRPDESLLINESLHGGLNDWIPPVGTWCEVYHYEKWRKCEVLAHRGGMVIYWVPGFLEQETGMSIPYWFHPMKTKEQEDKDELFDIILQGFRSFEDGTALYDIIPYIVDSAIEKGWRKE